MHNFHTFIRTFPVNCQGTLWLGFEVWHVCYEMNVKDSDLYVFRLNCVAVRVNKFRFIFLIQVRGN